MKTGKIIKRTFLTAGIIILILIVALIAAPFLFRDKIFNLVKTELNKQLYAVTDFSDVHISLFRSFPNVSVGIENLSVSNLEPFQGDTLLAAGGIYITLDVLKVIRGDYEIRKVDIEDCRIHALVNKAGAANWNIMRDDTTSAKDTDTSDSAPFDLKLKRYNIRNAYILYRDEASGMQAEITELNHSGSGDFSNDRFTLRTQTGASAVSFSYGGIPYLNKVKTAVDLDIDIDNTTGKYSFETEQIRLNGLQLSAGGFIQLPDSLSTVMDIRFHTPSNDFREILSLVPGIYRQDFKDIQTSGSLTLSGFVKGTMKGDNLPAWNVNLGIENGSFRYPDLPQAVTDIQISLKAESPGGSADRTVVNLEKGHISFGGAPFDFRLLLKTPVSDPWIDATAKGRIDLTQVQQFVKLEEGTSLTGIILADLTVKGFISAAEKKQYDKLDAAGKIELSDLFYTATDYPEGVRLKSLQLLFNPRHVAVNNLDASYLGSRITGSGQVNNLLNYYLSDAPLDGTISISADQLDLNKWMGTGTAETEAETAAAAQPAEPFVVPANLNLTLNAQAGRVIYDKLELNDVRGSVTISDETVYLKGVSAKALDGQMRIDGHYSTRTSKKQPDIRLTYQLDRLDIQKTFMAFNTLEKLMPASKYLSGKVSSQLTLDGKLDQGMNLVPESLTGKGDLLLIEGVLSKFAPLEELGKKLQIKELERITLKDIKNYFSISNGRVAVDPFSFRTAGIGFDVAGSHGLDQSLQYNVLARIPRSILGAQGNALITNLANQAQRKGIPVNPGEQIDLAVRIGGTVSRPVIETDLRQAAGNVVDELKKKAEEEIKAAADSIRTVLKDTADALKKQAEQRAREEIKKQLSGNKNDSSDLKKDLQEAGKDAEEKAKDALKNLWKKK